MLGKELESAVTIPCDEVEYIFMYNRWHDKDKILEIREI